MIIEQSATGYLKQYISRSDYLKAIINDDDKIPFIDGSILIYKNKTLKNEDFEGHINIQIKGKKVPLIKNDKIIKYSIRVQDLKGYLRYDGCIFFVVYVSENSMESKGYFVTLKPLFIKELLRVKKSNKTSISVSLQELPYDIKTFTNIVRNTYRDCRIQRNQIERVTLNNKTIQKFLNNGYIIVSNLEQVENKMDYDFLYNYKHDFYLKSTNGKSIISIENWNTILMLSKDINLEIWVNNVKYYDHYNLEEKDEIDNIYIGDSIRLVIDRKNNSITINYDFKNTKIFNKYLNDLEFIIKFIESKKIVFKDSAQSKEFVLSLEDSENIEDGLNTQMLKERLVYLNDVKYAFDLLGLNNDEELIVKNLAEIDERNIRFLVDNVIHNVMYKPKNANDISPFMLMTIKNLSFLIYAEKQSRGYRFLNPSTHRFNVFMRYEDERPDRKVSPYFCLKDVEIAKISNFDYDDIYYSFVNIKNIDDINMFIIRLIEAYDISNKKKLLDLVNRLADWVINNEIDNELWHCVKLNKIQSNLRINDILSVEDYDYLNSVIYNDSYDLNLKLGASLLLKNKYKFDYYYEKLSKNAKVEFVKYPIYKKFYTLCK